MAHRWVHIAVKAVFAGIGHIPARGGLLVRQRDPHDGFDRSIGFRLPNRSLIDPSFAPLSLSASGKGGFKVPR